ncbi:Calx-beta domain-containing protein [Sulfitobacter sp. HNIBRBA2951]|uniref:Calx-beta domain-containing protein n=1 Tax=Sulfitobacter aquimarinus TaxID=3158557 RepID=UPI0032DFB944
MLPIISLSPAVANEGSSLAFVITLSQPSLAPVEITYRTVQNGTATSDVDYGEVFNTVTIAPNDTTATIFVSAYNDSPNDGDENLTLQLSDPVNGMFSGGQPTLSATGVILDQDGSTFDRGLFVSDPQILESDSGVTQAVFEIRLSEAFGSSQTLSFTTADGTAIAGQDYVATSGTVTFGATQTVASVAVDVIGDFDHEQMETFNLVVTPNIGIAGGVGDSTGVATIIADDGDNNLPVISVLAAEALEGEPVRFEVILSEPSLADVTVYYRTLSDGSALLDIDVDESFGTLTIPAGQTVVALSFNSFNDTPDDGDENFSVQLSDPVNATLAGGGPTLTATGVVLDNDGSVQDRALSVSDPIVVENDSGGVQAVFEVRLSAPSATNLILNYTTADGSALAGQDYAASTGTINFRPGQTVASVAVDILGDITSETMETFSLVVTPGATIFDGARDSTGMATIVDDDTGSGMPIISVLPDTTLEGESLRFTVVLSELSLADVTFVFRTVQSGSAEADIDYDEGYFTHTIPAGNTVSFLSFSTYNDSPSDGDENLTLLIANPTNATLAGGETTLSVTGVILDNDSPDSDLALFVSDPSIEEQDSGETQAVFEVRLSAPSPTDITVSYTTADGSALAGRDYTATSGTITFLAGQTVAFVAVDILGDTDVEMMETFSLVVASDAPIVNGIRDGAGIATIRDDDTETNLPVLSIEAATATEGEALHFDVTLSEPSLADITFTYRTVADGSALSDIDYDEVLANATIPAGQTYIRLAVTTYNDSPDDRDENLTLEISDPVNAVLAGAQPTLTATGVISDNDGSTSDLALFVSDPTILETDGGAQQAVFEVRLSEASPTQVVLSYATFDGSATNFNNLPNDAPLSAFDYIPAMGTLTFLPGQTVAHVHVDLEPDASAEVMETFGLVVTPALPIVDGVRDASGTATILADDSETGLPVVSIQSADALEGEPVRFTVTLSQPSLADVTIAFQSIFDGSASAADMSGGSGTLTIPAGQTVATISYTTFGDSPDDGDENFTIELSNPTNAVLAGGEARLTATGVILDNDGTAEDRAVFVSDPIFREGDGGNTQAVFEIRLSEPADSTINLFYGTADGSATAGTDYVANAGFATFRPGQTVVHVVVDIIEDTLIEGAETFSLNVNGAANVFSTADASGVAIILNDDANGQNTTGSAANETFNGTSAADVLNGLGGSDSIFGGGSGDILRGGGMGDTINGANGEDSILGGQGRDLLYGGNDDDTITGNGQADTIFGGFGNDIITGGQGGDELSGDGGDDSINGATGADTLDGGAGADVLLGLAQGDELNGGSGNDFLLGGDGFDTLNGGNDNDLLDGANGNDSLSGDGGEDYLIGSSGLDTLNGGAGSDTLSGGGGNDMLEGGTGGDFLQGDGGSDTLRGNDGNDVMEGGANADSLYGQAGQDSLNGGGAGDLLNGGGDDDFIFGDSGNDRLFGGTGDDTLLGGGNQDTLYGGSGDDILDGGAAADTFVFAPNYDTDVITDFEDDIDTLDLSAYGFNNKTAAMANATQSGNDLVFDFGNGDTLVVENMTAAQLFGDLVV